jgi:hypothetical protein
MYEEMLCCDVAIFFVKSGTIIHARIWKLEKYRTPDLQTFFSFVPPKIEISLYTSLLLLPQSEQATMSAYARAKEYSSHQVETNAWS